MSVILTVEGLKTFMGLHSMTGVAQEAAQSIIDGLEADIAAYVRRPIVPTVFVDERVETRAMADRSNPSGATTIERRRAGDIRFKWAPVLSIQAFTVDGLPITPDQYELRSWGVRDVWPGFFPSSLIAPVPSLLVSYTAGLHGDDPSDEFAAAASAKLKRVAARDFNQIIRMDAAGVARLSVEGTDVQFAGDVRSGVAGVGGFFDRELESLIRWKRR